VRGAAADPHPGRDDRLYRASSRRLRRFLFVLARTIARPGRDPGLRWGDIQWDRRLITLMKFKGKKRRRDGVKIRTIPLDLVALVGCCGTCGSAGAGRALTSPCGWTGGESSGRRTASGAMRLARERAGLDPEGAAERVVCYTLRHTGATNATRAGVTDNTLARVMGHARTATTNRYQHLAGDDLVNAIDRVSARPRPRPAGPVAADSQGG
jgi:integrase